MGRVEQLQPLKGTPGEKGEPGDPGISGADGNDGLDGRDGKDGIDGKDGRDGIDGADGRDGKDGNVIVGPAGNDGSPDTPLQIADKINTLEGAVDFKVLFNVPTLEDTIKQLKGKLDISDIKNWNQPAKGRLDQRWHGAGDTVTAGANISITQNSNGQKVISATLPVLAGVTSLNGLTGAVNLVAGSNISISPSGQNLTITASGGVATITSPNSTLTIGGTTAVTADINLFHANTWLAAQGINVNSATAFKVEQTGVYNNILVVDTATPGVGIGTTPDSNTFFNVLGITPASTSAFSTGFSAQNINLISGNGGGSTNVGANTQGGTGGSVGITAGNGAAGSNGTNSNTGGYGGQFSFSSGNGANASAAGTVQAIAGNSGDYTFFMGGPGAATSTGSGSTQGGSSGSFSLFGSDAGTGSGSTGTNTGGIGTAFSIIGGGGGNATGGTTASAGGAGPFVIGTTLVGSHTGGVASGASGTNTGGGGLTVSILTSRGGQATASGGTVGIGGPGGSFLITTASGGNSTNASSTNNGGRGGNFTWITGAGATATGTGATNTGGNGGTFTLTFGNGGAASGTTATAISGNGGGWTWTAGNGGAVSTGTNRTQGNGGSGRWDAGIAGGGTIAGTGTAGTNGGFVFNINGTNHAVVTGAYSIYSAGVLRYQINATGQAWFGSTPVAQQTGDMAVALTNYGLVTSPTLAATYLRGIIDGTASLLVDNSVVTSLDWNNRTANDPISTVLIGWKNDGIQTASGLYFDGSGNPVFGNPIYDTAFVKALDLNNRVGYDNGGNKVFSFQSGGFFNLPNVTVKRAVVTDASSNLIAAAATSTEVDFLSGLSGLPKSLFDHVADANNGTTVETDLYSDAIAAGQLATDGDKLIAQYQVVCTGAALASQDMRIYFAGTKIYDSGALSIGAVTDNFTFNVMIIRESSSVVRCNVFVSTDFATLFPYSAYTRITGLTLSGTNVLKITGQAAGAGGASNQITAKDGYVQFTPHA